MPWITPGWHVSPATYQDSIHRLPRVYRRAYALMVGTAAVMGILAVIAGQLLDLSLIHI